MRDVAKNLALLTASTAVALSVAEGALRLAVHLPPPYRYPQVRYDPHPIRRFTLQPSQTAYTRDAPVTVDSRGFRSNGSSRESSPGGPVVLALGDSFTFGWGVPDEATWPADLERELDARLPSRPRIVNAGTVSYGVFQEMDLLKEKGVAEDPVVVIHALYWNDFMSAKAPSPGDRSILTPDGLFLWDRYAQPGNALLFLRRAIGEQSALGFTLRNVMRSVFENDATSGYGHAYTKVVRGEIDRAAWRPVELFYRELKTVAATYRFVSFAVILPVDDIVSLPESTAHPYPRLVRELLQETGIPFLDGFEVWRSGGHGRETFLAQGRDSHLNAYGYRILADALAEQLLRHPEIRSRLDPDALDSYVSH